MSVTQTIRAYMQEADNTTDIVEKMNISTELFTYLCKPETAHMINITCWKSAVIDKIIAFRAITNTYKDIHPNAAEDMNESMDNTYTIYT